MEQNAVGDKEGKGVRPWVLATESLEMTFIKVWGEAHKQLTPRPGKLEVLVELSPGQWEMHMRLLLGLLAKIKCGNTGPELRSMVVTWSQSSAGEAMVTQGHSINASKKR